MVEPAVARTLRRVVIRRGSSSVHRLIGLCTLLLLLTGGCLTGAFGSNAPAAVGVATSSPSSPASPVTVPDSTAEPVAGDPDRCTRNLQAPEPAHAPHAGPDSAPTLALVVGFEVRAEPGERLRSGCGEQRVDSSVELSQLSVLRI